jgi:hypothetical protein
VRPFFAGLAKKRQVLAAYNQLIGAKRQTFRKKAAKAANKRRQSGNTLPHGGFGAYPEPSESGKAQMFKSDYSGL